VMGLSRATRYGTATQALRHANQSVGVIVQVETGEALGQLEAIAQVPGVDAVFVGPADLSASLGHLGEPAHPQVMELLAQAVDRCKALGRPVGTMGATPDVVAQYRAMGFDFVGVGSDLGLMMRGAQAALSALRTQDTTIVHSVTAGTLTR
jgi:2-keto-3-deoxy-L-rhamnonate aldolase RhmA